MQRILIAIDRLNTWIGKIFSWSIVAMTLVITYEVFSRYVFSAPTSWAYDVSYMLYGTLFMMAGPYALARNGHVRGDFLYRKWPPRVQASVDLTLYILFFFAGVLALIYSGWSFFKISYMFNEHSSFSPNGPPLWPFKMLIPLVGCADAGPGIGGERALRHLHPQGMVAAAFAGCRGTGTEDPGGGGGAP
jgi:TRAP-type mannitol/chloroaromatic compound transport system permease small subunit